MSDASLPTRLKLLNIAPDWTGLNGYGETRPSITSDDGKFIDGFERRLSGAHWHGTRDAVKLEDCSRSRVYPCYHDVRMNLGIRGGVDHFAVPTVTK